MEEDGERRGESEGDEGAEPRPRGDRSPGPDDIEDMWLRSAGGRSTPLFLGPEEEPRRLKGRVSADNRGDVNGETGLLGWGAKEASMSWAVGVIGRAEAGAEVEVELITESRER